MERDRTVLRRVTNGRGWVYGLFWSWNVIFLASMVLGFAPQLLPEVLSAVRTGEIPTAFLVYGLTLTTIPAVAIVVGARVLRRSAGRLLAFALMPGAAAAERPVDLLWSALYGAGLMPSLLLVRALELPGQGLLSAGMAWGGRWQGPWRERRG